MKSFLLFMALSFSFASWSAVEYPVKNYSYLSDLDYQSEVQTSDKYIVMVFSSNYCLNRSIVDRSCFLFERKFDAFIPSFSSKVKIVGFNTYFENNYVSQLFQITNTPTVIIFKDNLMLKKMEATYAPIDLVIGRINWQDAFLQEVVNEVYKIR